MSKNVITIGRTKSVLDACQIYKEYKIGCLVVTDNDKCIGMLTERDIIERTICKGRDPGSTQIGEIMSSDIKTVHPLDTVENAIQIMSEFDIKKLPVIINDELAGIITVTDISHARPDLSKRFIESWIKPVWRD
jgi:CBS domain-containing protein